LQAILQLYNNTRLHRVELKRTDEP
jgi:hypothetical protein